MNSQIRNKILEILAPLGAGRDTEFSVPPQAALGDLSFPCFALAKAKAQNPATVAKQIAEQINKQGEPLIASAKAVGPYVNFFLNSHAVATLVSTFGENICDPAFEDSKEKIMVEFAHPNTHKAFHIGHLRNIITGESLVRLLEHVGHAVVRANYQGDVGLHIAKCFYGIFSTPNYETIIKSLTTATSAEQAKFLGQAYASGSSAYEENDDTKAKVMAINEKIYSGDTAITALYKLTRSWSLSYFENNIYKRLSTHFDRLYFESEVFERGREIVKNNMANGVFKASDGAVIFEGSKYGLHERVFLNSKDLPTYEAKDLALAEKQFNEFHPARIYHVVGKEQLEYFKVVFKALEFTFPESAGREHHVDYGWVHLKSGKMSSRTGQVILAEEMIAEVKAVVLENMSASDVANKDEVAERVAIAAIKYAFLRTSTENDIAFDIKSSVATSGDSGAYLLYMGARIKSILKKEPGPASAEQIPAEVMPEEATVLLHLDQFQDTVSAAAARQDPSLVAHYLYSLAQKFTSFYEACPVLKSAGATKNFRLNLLRQILAVAERSLYLLGIKTVEEM
ncbi:MAG: arginine--tRNA ligase [Candidatus Magasanikbacteria bacterium]|nr:arginine--tRNA ligase [Candidatus Magasanikbacteria bacterium]